MIQLFVFGDVPPLADSQVADLTAPLAVPADNNLRQLLSDRVELAARRMVMFFTESDPEAMRRYTAEYRAELGRLAADPARVLGIAPSSDGATSARTTALQAADWAHLDPDTRTGAAAIGDLAATLLERYKPGRADAALSMGEEQVFNDLSECLREVAPTALDTLPSNELGGERHAAIQFAESFIQLVVDRARSRLADPSARVSARLDALLNKQDRALLDGIRRERKFYRKHRDWFEGN